MFFSENHVYINNTVGSLNLDVKNTYRPELSVYAFIYIHSSIRSFVRKKERIEQFLSISPMWLFFITPSSF